MGKSTPQAPAPPDPYKTAAAQTGSNLNTAVANSILGNANEVGPTGTVSYSQIGQQSITGPNGEIYQVPQFQKTTSLSPEQQQLYNEQTQLGSDLNNFAIGQAGRLQDVLGRPIDSFGLPSRGVMPTNAPQGRGLSDGPSFGSVGDAGPLTRSVNLTSSPTSFGDAGRTQGDVSLGRGAMGFADAGDITRSVGPTDYSADRTRVEDAIYSRLNPQLDRDRTALETNLVNQGFARGSDAFRNEMDAFGRQSNDARMQAILAGGQEQSRLADLAFRGGEFSNTAQQQAYDQAQGRGLYDLGVVNQNNQTALNEAGFHNQAQQQKFGQEQARGDFAQQGIAANNQTALAAGEFANTAQGQAFDQAITGTGFNNDQAQRGYQNTVAQTQYGNDLGQQQFGNEIDLAQTQDTARERALQEALSLRNQPINEISSLMNGGQVSMPQFAQYKGGEVAGTPIGQYLYDTANLNAQNYQTQLAAQTAKQNALIGGLAGLGGAGLYGLAGGKFKI